MLVISTAMEQHPIPQQISSYQFKLVGDMTLKQFFQVAGGVVIALIFYSTPLHPIIKWPLIIFFVLLGAALAFLPFEERPLEKWIVAFFRSIYSPTLYTWKKTAKPPIFYTETAVVPEIKNVQLSTTTEANTAKLEEAEKSFLSKIGGLWSNLTPTAKPAPTQPVAVSPNPTVSVVNVPPASTQSVVEVQNQNKESQPMDILQPIEKPEPKPETVSNIAIPHLAPIVVTKSTPKIVVEEKVSQFSETPIKTEEIVGQKLQETKITANAAEFSVDSAPPSPPIAVNTIVGQVMDQDRKIIEGAILEIKDSLGRPVRALRSNKAGHFIIVTPLQNGKYEVTIEKDGFMFEPISFDAIGEMIPPIAIRGKKV